MPSFEKRLFQKDQSPFDFFGISESLFSKNENWMRIYEQGSKMRVWAGIHNVNLQSGVHSKMTPFCKNFCIAEKFSKKCNLKGFVFQGNIFLRIQTFRNKNTFKNLKPCYLLYFKKQPTMWLTFLKHLDFNKNIWLDVKTIEINLFSKGMNIILFLSKTQRNDFFESQNSSNWICFLSKFTFIFSPMKAESSYFSNFIMCAPACAHVRANFAKIFFKF